MGDTWGCNITPGNEHLIRADGTCTWMRLWCTVPGINWIWAA